MTTAKKKTKQDAALDEVVRSPGRDDVHEQREPMQPREAIVARGGSRSERGAPAKKAPPGPARRRPT